MRPQILNQVHGSRATEFRSYLNPNDTIFESDNYKFHRYHYYFNDVPFLGEF